MLAHTTKYLLVSMTSPGPTSPSHQPSSSDAPRLTWVLPVKACWMSTALSPAAFNVPQHSKAMVTEGSTPPASNGSSPIWTERSTPPPRPTDVDQGAGTAAPVSTSGE